MARLQILGAWALAMCAVAASGCGSKKHHDSGGAGGAGGSSGHSAGGAATQGGATHQGGSTTAAGVAGDTSSTSSGGADLGEGGAIDMTSAGAGTINTTGGVTSAGGTTDVASDTGGSDAGGVPSGDTSSGGTSSGGTTESGGTLGLGGTNSGGTVANSGGTLIGSLGGSFAAGAAGDSGQAGSDNAGAGGVSEPGSVCGDGVLDAGEACCTSDWVQTQIQAFTAAIAQSSTGSQSCIAKSTSSIATACNTALCAQGAVGCNTLIRRSQIDYDPATQTIAGNSDIEVTGHLTTIIGSCTFTLTLNDTQYTADVITQVTPQTLHIGIDNVNFDYTPKVTGCESVPGANSFIASYVSTVVEPTLRQQLISTVNTTLPCPY